MNSNSTSVSITDAPATTRPWIRALLTAEFAALFFGLPMAYLTLRRMDAAPPLIPCIIAFSVGCLTLLLTDSRFEKKELWGGLPTRMQGLRIVALFVFAAGVLGAGVWLLTPDMLFGFPREAPRIWMMVMLLYPLFSVYPQEIVFRPFIFHRYRNVFSSESSMILASAAAFGWSHVLFGEWLSVLLTFAGGLLFAYTYSRTRSTLAVVIEHALYGCFVFTIGMGQLFYAGGPVG